MILRKIFILMALALLPALAAAAAADKTSEDLAPLLGGLIQSDRWLINKDKYQEEFIGRVRYSNDNISLNAQRALSDRLNKIYTLKGNVFASYKLPQNATAEIRADKIVYNQKKDSGLITSSAQKQAQAVYKTTDNTFKAYADKINFGQKFSSFTLSGWAQFEDDNNTLYAKEISYDAQSGIVQAQGARPLILGFGDEGDYALQADFITANIYKGGFEARGRVHGWFVSAQDISDFTKGQIK